MRLLKTSAAAMTTMIMTATAIAMYVIVGVPTPGGASLGEGDPVGAIVGGVVIGGEVGVVGGAVGVTEGDPPAVATAI